VNDSQTDEHKDAYLKTKHVKEELPKISDADTVEDPRAMMIMLGNTPAAFAAVLAP
jgi:hypothetical protein